MPACCVLNCSSRNSRNQVELTYNRFPGDESLKTKWLEAIGSNNLDNLPKIRFVCSLHFEKSNFDDEGNLHDDAVPTVFIIQSNRRKKSKELDSDQESDRLSEMSSQSINGEGNNSSKRKKIFRMGQDQAPKRLSQYQLLMSHTATTKQIDALLSFLEAHKGLALAKTRGPDGRSRSKMLWRRLTNELNRMGGCVKNVKQWQRVWADKKYLAKKASACVKSGEMSYGQLSPQEMRIIAMIGGSDDKNSQHSINKTNNTEMDSDQESDRLSEISSQSFTADKTTKKTKERKSRKETISDNESVISEKSYDERNLMTSNITTSEQIDVLLSFLEKNPGLARNTMRNIEARVQAKILWDTLTSELNVMSGCVKSVKQWQKVWADKKYLAKKASAGCKQAGLDAANVLTPHELKIISIIEDTGQTEMEVEAGTEFQPIFAPERQPIEKLEVSPPNSPGLSHSPSPQRVLGDEKARLTRKQLCDDNVSEHSRTSRTFDENNVNNRLIRMEERRLDIEVQNGKELAQIRQELSQLRQAVQELVGIFKSSVS